MRLLKLDITRDGNEEVRITEDTKLQLRFVGRGKTEAKKRLRFVHVKPHINSRIDVKVALYGAAKLDLEALLVIEKAAVGTDSYLKLDTLLVGEKATARAVPSLEIKTDNVKAGHGATIGSVPAEHLYYLASRGIGPQKGEDLIVKSFLHGF